MKKVNPIAIGTPMHAFNAHLTHITTWTVRLQEGFKIIECAVIFKYTAFDPDFD